MKKLLLACSAGLLALSYAAVAGAGPLVDVTATVKTSCTTGTNGAMSIVVDQVKAATQSFTVITDAKIQCTANKTLSVSASSLNGTAVNAACLQSGISGFVLKAPVSGKTIPYMFKCDPTISGLGFGTSKDVPINIGGLVLGPDAQAADYSNGEIYADRITLTVSY